ncbi:aspartate kinase [Pontivivens insulae]|uniref:Aspartokinase n=1 Tax=Pontivivens insulae TaxID=1639689 RepID=A0A2R8A755_9RHOB|nr:aspartate kinase [Pontivivens insulae]RED18172.1 aspartate kinase [Pontivivens insulae]SPF28069.1 Aspartate kinase Ask_LysC [Pontivivens insulae]
MPRLVMKFGGTSVADIDRIRNAASKVKREIDAGYDVAVIVSAMSGKTNELVGWVRDASTKPGTNERSFYDAREYDSVVASGEQVTAGLMALCLQELGVDARSWLGWQVPVRTTSAHGVARITEIDTANLDAKFEQGVHAVIAGFQGLSDEGRITTLGRGGSDTTAVAFAAALGAERCDIYTDVDGVYTTDPRITKKARKLDRIAYEEMLELASLGAKVLQVRSVELAMAHKVRLAVRSSFSDEPGTLVCDEDEIMEANVISGVAFSRDEAKITMRHLADQPGVAASVFGPLADAGVNVDMIIQDISAEGFTDITFSCPVDQVAVAVKALEDGKAAGTLTYDDLETDEDVSKVSIVGIGMRSHAGIASKMFAALSAENVNIKVITTSEIKVSVLIDRRYLELAVQSLHDAFGLEKAG